MADIKALKLLSDNLTKAKEFSEVPVEDYKQKVYVQRTDKFLDEVRVVIDSITKYSEDISEGLQLLVEEIHIPRNAVVERLDELLEELDKHEGDAQQELHWHSGGWREKTSSSTVLYAGDTGTGIKNKGRNRKKRVEIVEELRDLTSIEAKRQNILLAISEAEEVVAKLQDESAEDKVDISNLRTLMKQWMTTRDNLRVKKHASKRQKAEQAKNDRREESRKEENESAEEKVDISDLRTLMKQWMTTRDNLRVKKHVSKRQKAEQAKNDRREESRKEVDKRKKKEEETRQQEKTKLDDERRKLEREKREKEQEKSEKRRKDLEEEEALEKIVHELVEAKLEDEVKKLLDEAITEEIERVELLKRDYIISTITDDLVEKSILYSSIMTELIEEVTLDDLRRFVDSVDPQNWKPIIYTRTGHDVSSYRDDDVICVVFAMDDELHRDDITVTLNNCSNDDVDLAVSEKLSSSLLTIESAKGDLDFQEPIQVYIPGHTSLSQNEEVKAKVTIDDSEWSYKATTQISLNSVYERLESMDGRESSTGIQLVGVWLSGFKHIRFIAISKPISQAFTVDEPGATITSDVDGEIAVTFPEGCFDHPTKVNIEVLKGHNNKTELLRRYHPYCEDVYETNAFVLVECDESPKKPLTVQLNKRILRGGQRASYQLRGAFRPKGGTWQLMNDPVDSLMHIQPHSPNLQVCRVETVPGSIDSDNLQKIKEMHCFANETTTRLLVRQRGDNPEICMIHWLKSDDVQERLSDLEFLRYTKGPDSSPEFCVLDGQCLTLKTEGNVQFSKEVGNKVQLTFRANEDQAKKEVSLFVKDLCKQKDCIEYRGNLVFELEKDNRKESSDKFFTGKLILTLPKPEEPNRPKPKPVPVHFDHYLTALAKFVSMKFAEVHNHFWLDFCSALQLRREKLEMNIKAKYGDLAKQMLYEKMLTDWMKSTPRGLDKVFVVLCALQKSGMGEFRNEVQDFVHIHKVCLGDKELKEKTKMIGMEWEFLARELGFSVADIDKIKMDHLLSEHRILNMLCQWREREDTIKTGCNVLDFFLSCLRQVAGYKSELEFKLKQEIRLIKRN